MYHENFIISIKIRPLRPKLNTIEKYRTDYLLFKQNNISKYKIEKELDNFIKEWTPYNNMISKGEEVSKYDKNFPKLNRKTEEFFKNHFSEQVYKHFIKTPQAKNINRLEASNLPDENKVLYGLAYEFFDNDTKRNARKIKHKFSFLNYILQCLNDYGLHENIQKRKTNIFGRYSILIEYNENSKRNKKLNMLLLSIDNIKKDFIDPYLKKEEIFIDGIRLTHNSIQKINIFRTVFNDIEIELHKKKNDIKTDLNLIRSFQDVTSEFITTSAVNAGFSLGDNIKDLIHPQIWRKVENLIRSGEFSKAVLTAYIELNDIVKNKYKSKKGFEKDGVDLMRQAFKESDPVFVLTDDLKSDNGKSEQDGYMQLFAGSMRAFRNPNAHKNLSTNLKDAIEKLIIASHLLKKFEDRS